MPVLQIIQTSLAITGIFNCLVAAIFLFITHRGNIKANRLLGLMLLAVAIKITFALLPLFNTPWTQSTLFIYLLCHSGFFSFGPLLYLYLLAYTRSPIKWAAVMFTVLPLFIPFIVYFLKSDVGLFPMQMYFLAFLLLSFRHIYRYYRKSENVKPFYKEWYTVIWSVYAFIWLVVNILFVDFNFYIIELSTIFTGIFYLVVVVGIHQFWFKKGDSRTLVATRNMRIHADEEDQILIEMEKAIRFRKIHTDPEVNLPKVASMLQTSPHKLSYVINTRLGMSFNDYINFNRISEIKEAISKPEYQSAKLSGLAFDYGFNSISAFNIAFRKFTDTTPSQYRKAISEESPGVISLPQN